MIYKYKAEVRKEGSIGSFSTTGGTVEFNEGDAMTDDIALSKLQLRIISQHREAGYETRYIAEIACND